MGFSDLDAVIGGMLDVFKDLSAFEKGLGRNTAPIQADSTQGFPFNNGSFEAKLRGPDGGNITARTTSDNNEIVIHGDEGFGRAKIRP